MFHAYVKRQQCFTDFLYRLPARLTRGIMGKWAQWRFLQTTRPDHGGPRPNGMEEFARNLARLSMADEGKLARTKRLLMNGNIPPELVSRKVAYNYQCLCYYIYAKKHLIYAIWPIFILR